MATGLQVYPLLPYLVSFYVFVGGGLNYINFQTKLNSLRSFEHHRNTKRFFNNHEFQFTVFYSAQKVAPFYEEWWFLVVVALVGLIFILLLVFILIIRGQSKKYAKKSESGECTLLQN